MNNLQEKCGCGRPTRYVKDVDGVLIHSCNKYGRCPSYAELVEKLDTAISLLNAYRDKRAVDGLNGRSWDEAKHFRAEARIVTLEVKAEEVENPS